MTEHEEGIEQVDVRTMWPHEALDFTPWLARNLHLLGEELGMKLELVQQEKPVGPLYLDILAREPDTGVMVAIENQLEWTDLTHLGQLLAYATGCDARVAIWVASEFMYEYARTLHRLNEWTRDEIGFYGAKVEVVKKAGDSCPKPRFRKVVYPGGWNKEITRPPDSPPSPYIQKYHDFFHPLGAELVRMGFADRHLRQFDHTGRFFPSRFNRGIGYAASLEKGKDAWVTLHIRPDDKEITKALVKWIFDELQKDQKQIEECLEGEWHWFRHDNVSFSSINLRRDGSIDDPPEKLEETREWMTEHLPKLKEVFDPRLQRVMAELGAAEAGP